MDCNVCPTGHAVVCGFGHLGIRIAEQLRQRGCEVVAVEIEVDDAARRAAEQVGCTLIEGDICDDGVLESIVSTASCLIAVTGDDRANLEAGIEARQLNPTANIVIRLFDQSLARRVETAFGIRALSASFLASPAYVSAATDDSILAMFSIDDCYLSLFRSDVPCAGTAQGVWVTQTGDGLELAGEPPAAPGACLYAVAQDHHERRRSRPATHERKRKARTAHGLSVPHLLHELAQAWRHASSITRGLTAALISVGLLSVFMFSWFGRMTPLDSLYFVVTTMTTVGYGDFNLQHAPPALKVFGVLMMLSGAGLLATVYAMIADRVLTARVELLLGKRPVNLIDHTIVVGLGNVGFRVAHDMQRLGAKVVAIELNDDLDNVSTARSQFPVVIGDASRESVLRRAGIDQASAVLALTDNPMLNLSVALHARERNPEIRTVLRTYDVNFARRFEGLGLDAVLSTSAIASPAFVDAAVYPDVQGSFRFGDDDVLVVRLVVTESSAMHAKSVADIGRATGVAVTQIAEKASSPYRRATPECVLASGNRAIALVLRQHIARLTAPKA